MSDDLRLDGLRCEYRFDPLGIDIARPRLSWRLVSDRPGARQSAYQIRVARSEAGLRDGGGADLWDSGRVPSDQSVHVEYAGAQLGSGERAYWTVRVWDENGEPSEAGTTAWWETGLLGGRGEWTGEWVGAALVGGPRTPIPCPYLRRGFAVEKPVARARLYVTALGLYEFYINGSRIGKDVFTPGWTDYNVRVQYQTYDVSDVLRPGENACGAILGDGWYCGHVEWRGRQRYGDRPRLLAQLVLTYDDGATDVVVTDGSWKTAFGPLLEADLLMGESYDARLEFGDWSSPGYDDARWQPVQTFPDPPGLTLVAQQGPTVRATEEVVPIGEPVALPKWPAPDYLFDMGVNLVGRVRLRVKGPAGATIRLRFAEVLKEGPKAELPGGGIYIENLRTARQTDYYTLKGDPDGEVWEPRFTFHGFRYVEVSGWPAEKGAEHAQPTAQTLTGIVLHSDTPPTGVFECSDPLLNQLQKNIDWGQRGNFLDIPTDCPQRDERLGWTGDAQVFARTAAFNRDVAGFFTKWQRDLADAQAQNPRGAFPSVAPNTGGVDADGGPAWADAGILCPWTVYLVYGDTRLLAEHYDSMVRFVAYLEETSRDHIRCYDGYKGFTGFGDWLAMDAGRDQVMGATPKDLIGTAFFAHDARLMSRIASVLGKEEDTRRYARLSEDVRAAFCRRFVTAEGLVASGTQTANVLALHFDLLPPELRPAVADALVRDIERRGGHLSTGFVGSSYLSHALIEAGKLATAYELLHQTAWPSWLYAVTQGATTIWERWDGWTHDKGFQDPGMNSFNHYAYGAIGAWLYQVVAGIDADPERPGYKHILLRPRPGGRLTWARAVFDSLYGRIESAWRIEGGRFLWEVVVPPNTTATACLPPESGGEIRELEPGRHVLGAPLAGPETFAGDAPPAMR